VGSLIELYSGQLLRECVELGQFRAVSHVHRRGKIAKGLVDAVARRRRAFWRHDPPAGDQFPAGRTHSVQILHRVHVRDRSVQVFPLEPLGVVQKLAQLGQDEEGIWVQGLVRQECGGVFVVLTRGPKLLARQHDVVPNIKLCYRLGGKSSSDVLPLQLC
jgi:hypothetical protein